MADQKFISAANLFGWGQSFNATGKFPLIAKRVWETYADMIAFVGDTSDVCPAGVVLTVVNDTDSKKNGAYFVASCPTLENPELPVEVQKIGSGEKLVAATYADALKLATSDNIGAVVYVTTETEDGKAGLYVVTAEDTLERLGTTTATGDLSGDVASLKTDVASLKTAVESIDYPVDDVQVDGKSVVTGGVANIVLTDYAKKSDLESKVDVITATPYFNKVDGIAENATNVQKIVFNGVDIALDTVNHSFTLNTPEDKVLGVSTNDKVLSLNGDKMLEATLGLNYYKADGSYEIQLVGKNSEVIARIDAKDFVKDGMLSSVELVSNPADQSEGTYLVFSFNTEAGITDPIYVAVTDLIDVYTSGNGIFIDGKSINAVVKSGDAYLEVTAEGIASKGIDAAILAAKNDLNTAITAKIAGLESKHTEDITNVRNLVSEIKVKDVDTTASNGIALSLEDSKVKVNVDTETLVGSLIGSAGVIGPISGASIKLGVAINDGSEEANEIISASTSVQSAIQILAGQIQAAVAGGITAIDGGEYITVGGTATSKTLTLDVAKIGDVLVDDTSALRFDTETGKLVLVWDEL